MKDTINIDSIIAKNQAGQSELIQLVMDHLREEDSPERMEKILRLIEHMENLQNAYNYIILRRVDSILRSDHMETNRGTNNIDLMLWRPSQNAVNQYIQQLGLRFNSKKRKVKRKSRKIRRKVKRKSRKVKRKSRKVKRKSRKRKSRKRKSRKT